VRFDRAVRDASAHTHTPRTAGAHPGSSSRARCSRTAPPSLQLAPSYMVPQSSHTWRAWYMQFGARSRWVQGGAVEVINRAPTHRLSSSHPPPSLLSLSLLFPRKRSCSRVSLVTRSTQTAREGTDEAEKPPNQKKEKRKNIYTRRRRTLTRRAEKKEGQGNPSQTETTRIWPPPPTTTTTIAWYGDPPANSSSLTIRPTLGHTADAASHELIGGGGGRMTKP
jgi:hypothetical protein